MSEIQSAVNKHIESEAFKAMIHSMVKGEFKEMVSLISMPFIVVTVPMAILVGYMVIYQFNQTNEVNDRLATELNQLSISVAKLEGRVKQ